VYDRGTLVRTAQSASLTAALVSSPAANSVVASGSSLPPPPLPPLSAVPVSKTVPPPQTYVYDNNKTYAVLDDCGKTTSMAAPSQTTNDAAWSARVKLRLDILKIYLHTENEAASLRHSKRKA